MKNTYFMIITGILLSLAFPPLPFFFIAFFAFIPLFLAIENKIEDPKKNLSFPLYLTFFFYHTGTNWWISSFQENTDPFLMASGFALDIAHPFFFFIPVYIYYHLRKKYGLISSVLSFPIVWTLFEWAHGLGEFSYPWLTIGNNQIMNIYWIQFIDITGVWGASFFIALFNSFLFIYLKTKSKKNLIPLSLIIILPLIYGFLQISNYDHDEIIAKNESKRVSIIQASIDPWDKWDGGPMAQIGLHLHLQDSLSSVAEDIDLSVWSETTVLRLAHSFNTDLRLASFQSWVNNRNLPILTGFVHDYRYEEGEERQVSARFIKNQAGWYESFNSALLVQPNSEAQVYHKSKLTPFAERIPYVDNVSFLMDYIKWGVGISSWGLGAGAENLNYNSRNSTFNLGNIICIESIYPGFCREFTNQGANLLTLITNDAWYDYTPGPAQHFAIAQVRAIENRRYIARAANTGQSGFIMASGQVLKKVDQYKRLAFYEDLPLMNEKTIYVEYGDWFPFTLLAIFIIILILFRSQRGTKLN